MYSFCNKNVIIFSQCNFCRRRKGFECIKKFSINFLAVRYGRVPKRSRDLSTTSIATSTTHSSSTGPVTPTTPNGSDELVTATRVNTPNNIANISSNNGNNNSSSSSTPQMCPVATSPDLILPDSDSTSESHDLTVYDIILCVSQAHRTYCTYTDDHVRRLTRCPITIPVSENKDDNNVSFGKQFFKCIPNYFLPCNNRLPHL